MTAPISGQTTVTTAGTEVVLGTGTGKGPLAVRALSSNTGYMYLGNDGSGAVSSSSGYQLGAGDQIIFESVGNPYAFGSGTFRATSSDSATQALLNAVNWAALPSTPITNHFNVLHSQDNRDFLVDAAVAVVPEPATLTLLAPARTGLGFARRRKL